MTTKGEAVAEQVEAAIDESDDAKQAAIEAAQEAQEDAEEAAAEIAAAAMESERGKRITAIEEGMAACQSGLENLRAENQAFRTELVEIKSLIASLTPPQVTVTVAEPNPQPIPPDPASLIPAPAPEEAAAVQVAVTPAETPPASVDAPPVAPARPKHRWT